MSRGMEKKKLEKQDGQEPQNSRMASVRGRGDQDIGHVPVPALIAEYLPVIQSLK